MKNQLRFYSATLILFLNACSTGPIIPFSDPEGSPTPVVPPHTVSRVIPPHVVSPDVATLKVTDWNTLSGWRGDDIRLALDAFLQSCKVLRNQKLWMKPCKLAVSIPRNDNAILHKFFEHNFKPHQVLNSNGSSDGLITGYYEPLLKGSR
ncbi:MAG: transglycosylase, partial [Nitrosomonadaceae bacterium]|nr:transglycosylase [Nitrosomonadaceae bacterium]